MFHKGLSLGRRDGQQTARFISDPPPAPPSMKASCLYVSDRRRPSADGPDTERFRQLMRFSLHFSPLKSHYPESLYTVDKSHLTSNGSLLVLP